MDANRELIEALNQIEKEKDISKRFTRGIGNSLVAACKNNFGRADNIKVNRSGNRRSKCLCTEGSSGRSNGSCNTN